MRYGRVVNDVLMRRRITPSNLLITGVFDNNDINLIDYYCSRKENDLLQARVASDSNDLRKDIRESKIKFFSPDEENSWIFQRINDCIDKNNDEFYGFDLFGYDFFQYTVYEGEKKGQYDWHSDLLYDKDLGDTLYNSVTRKLTLVMLLNEPGVDFTGGEFQINTDKEESAVTIDLKKGLIVMFPSFVLHRVKPVLSGVRKSIVIWVEGPKFR